MRKPAESLDHFNVNPAPIELEPPVPVSLSSTGEFEVLRPLVRPEDPTKFKVVTTYTYVRPPGQTPSWYKRSLAMAGTLGLIAMIFLSAILIGIYEPPDDQSLGSVSSAGERVELAIDQQLYDELLPGQDMVTPEIPTIPSIETVERQIPRTFRSYLRPRRTRPAVRFIAYHPPRRIRRPVPVVTTEFVPTTLIIYAENGEIKSRIEPWLAVAYRRPLS